MADTEIEKKPHAPAVITTIPENPTVEEVQTEAASKKLKNAKKAKDPSKKSMKDYVQGFTNFFYNPRMKTVFGRSSLNWGNVMTSSSAVVIKDAFLTLNSPALFASAVQIDMSGSKLKEVKICYDLQFRYASCT
ncbi:unnamed protein product [Adineta steineri]|uniref:Uncharacterized protein n=1 Tax=Adineta steineri TaxID=433720 RepID=A0A814WYH2_9BILA|nr:unnamed protein product [Adineta steineri]